MKKKHLKSISASDFYKLINRDSVLETYQYIKDTNPELIPSTKYILVINDELFPPKDFLRKMAELKGYSIIETSLFGGKANKPFENLGFSIINKKDYPDLDTNKTQMKAKEIKKELVKEDIINNISKLNQILYGPPGTGKTYATKAIAVKIANPNFIINPNLNETKKREEIVQEYERLQQAGYIVFTTFHQSMSYEDFVEGIKPKTNKEGKIHYGIEDGIYKNLVKKALSEYLQVPSNDSENFDTLYNDFIDTLKPFIGKREPIFKTKMGVSIMLENLTDKSILIKYLWTNKKQEVEGQHTFSVTKEKLKTVLLEEIIPNDVKNLKAEIYPLVGHIHGELFAVYKRFYDFVINQNIPIESIQFDAKDLLFSDVTESISLLPKDEIIDKKVNNYVLIIDEINRGNVSAIFGELITLLESDKRLGKDEEIKMKLSYSKKEFIVPSNIYIIGTMNTADRSVEALDTALRRRFSFEEILPKPDLIKSELIVYKLLWKYKGDKWEDSEWKKVERQLNTLFGFKPNWEADKKSLWVGFEKEGYSESDSKKLREYLENNVDLAKMLKTINNRIEILIDKDHQIGHSYFMGIESLEDLRHVFQDKIIPLLEEYFYGDFGKIGLVLGNSFIRKKEVPKAKVFADFEGYDDSGLLAEKNVYEYAKPLNEIDISDFQSIYLNALK